MFRRILLPPSSVPSSVAILLLMLDQEEEDTMISRNVTQWHCLRFQNLSLHTSNRHLALSFYTNCLHCPLNMLLWRTCCSREQENWSSILLVLSSGSECAERWVGQLSHSYYHTDETFISSATCRTTSLGSFPYIRPNRSYANFPALQLRLWSLANREGTCLIPI